ncbi:Predicted arabinose efflux permease, MFS family [Shimia gijangensis]|uniref:Predicted arabinose efflux permease, MFS family n=1 Tax=Shimia gijangensis TaxID=1470563 RepID=A0A1M6JP79_9RHOB|nr:MFS transporter [Shimia gijangensis]SHJ48527.1 Predicted arabinose efflux permease, MFS family [Shimia gijangensis]
MKNALYDNWALFLGMIMLMVANGLLVTLLTIRGAGLGFSDLTISIMQAAYPLGALAGTAIAPRLVEKVGHIRAFSALASLVSIAAILHLLTSDPATWSAMRFLAGVCYPGLYVITESWLSAKSENKNRAQILSLYFMIWMAGPAIGTALVAAPDPSGNMLFGLVSILISLSIVPLLLSGNKAPDYEVPDRMSVRRLYGISPTAVVGNFVSATAVAAWFIALPLFALARGMTTAQASGVLVIAMIVGALVQYPVGWISDKTDRRLVLAGLGVIGGVTCLWMFLDASPTSMIVGFSILAGASLPMYAVCTAHANDHLKSSQIVAASGTMLFILNVGQFIGILIGPNMVSIADGRGFVMFLLVLCFMVTVVALVRRAQEVAPEDTGSWQAMPVLGAPQSGVLQTESRLAEEEEGNLD